MNDFSIIVNLYRLSSYPHFDGAKFSARIAYNADVKSLFKRILNPTFQAGTADEIEVDGHLIYLHFMPFPDHVLIMKTFLKREIFLHTRLKFHKEVRIVFIKIKTSL